MKRDEERRGEENKERSDTLERADKHFAVKFQSKGIPSEYLKMESSGPRRGPRREREEVEIENSRGKERRIFFISLLRSAGVRSSSTKIKPFRSKKKNGPQQPRRRAALPDAGGAELWARCPCTSKYCFSQRRERGARARARERKKKGHSLVSVGGPNRKKLYPCLASSFFRHAS